MDHRRIFEGLNDEQRLAVETVRGPVCILAGAGSGKTTTITRRIANQVATASFPAGQILAVTFTDKAAGEMRSRLAALGVEGVRACTFHSAALGQLRHLAHEPLGEILPSKVLALRQIANTLPKPYRFRPAADLATEIEWAKNRRIDASAYPSSLRGHEPPIPQDLMASVYKRYESGKQKRNLIDFEDLLEFAIQMFQSDEWAREQFGARFRAFTVDEYQDVNLLQETLLRTWLGERDDLCVVGDDYQSIYGFTGASPDYLLQMPGRFANTAVVRLESNYRSTPQVLELANRLVPRLGGAEKVLRATRANGPVPVLRHCSIADDEMRLMIERIRELRDSGVSFEEMAVLYRVNFRSEDYEEALAAARIPYQVKDGAFLHRQTARQMLSSLKRSDSTEVAKTVRKIADRAGYMEELPDGLGDQELTRQNDLARFVRLADEFDSGGATAADFVADIGARFGTEGEGRGVNLLTYHRAKGLEFEAVFLPRLENGELPFRRSKSDESVAEERRLLYVGITRAKSHLTISWVNEGRRGASPFVGELAPKPPARARARAGSSIGLQPPREEFAVQVGAELELSGGFRGRVIAVGDESVAVELEGGGTLDVAFGERVTSEGRTLPLGPPAGLRKGDQLLDALKRWRRERARQDGVPAFVIFHDSTLEEMARRCPESTEALSRLGGVGPVKIQRYGAEILALISDS